MNSVFTKLIQEWSVVKVGSMVASRQSLLKNSGYVDELDKHFDIGRIVIRRERIISVADGEGRWHRCIGVADSDDGRPAADSRQLLVPTGMSVGDSVKSYQ
jgi:hypothetical protein